MVGQALGKYRIVEKLGEGGMGIVYRARDEGLNRNVAVKILPPGALTDEGSRKRFRKEALTLAKLNHPNIESLYDLDNKDGVDFLVMEYVPGATLAERLAGGALPEKEVLTLGMQVAAALEEAHDQGVVHRDLKPGNIGVTPKGQVKLLDFGLAKVLPQAAEVDITVSLTETPAMAGTLPYMPPELLRGEPTDTRSDIYSLGVVLYEMSTGQRPFREPLASRLTDAILHQLPIAPRTLDPRVSPELERIILKCMEKKQENRYQSAKELRVDLGRLLPSTAGAAPARRRYRFLAPVNLWLMAGGAVALFAALAVLNIGVAREKLLGKGITPRIESIAVLPLENLSGDPQQEYLADGMTETLIAHLAKISSLRVISRTSVMRYKGTNKALPEIARELGADALIEGSVMRSGSRIRITAQLIYAPSDKHLWGESYERDLSDVMVLQSEVARAIAHEIKIKLTPQDQTRLATARPVNSEAYEFYLKGRYYWNKMSGPAVTRAAEYFSKAIALDGNYAPVYVGLADCYLRQADLGNLPPSEAYGRAKTATLRALEIDNELAEAHASLAVIRADYDWDWERAETEFRRALALDPKHVNAHQWHAVFLAKMGRFKEAFPEIEIAKELDPLSLPVATSAGSILRYARRYDEAIEELRRAIDLEPSFKFTHVELAEVYGLKGMFQEAASEWSRVNALSGNPERLHYAAVRDAAGYQRSVQLWIEHLRESSKREYVSPMSMAAAYARLGKSEQVLAWLEDAYRQRDPALSGLKVEPLFDFLRSNPRFQDLLRRMNFPD
jgi:serine/threonine-protein kinase